jgi:hypothetical protein
MQVQTSSRSIALLAPLALLGCGVVQLNGKPLGGGTSPSSTSAGDTTGGGGGGGGTGGAERGLSTEAPEAASSAPRGPTVIARLPQFKKMDAYTLDKVAEAMKLVTPDMVYHTRLEIPREAYAPSNEGQGAYGGRLHDSCPSDALGKHGTYLVEQLSETPAHMELVTGPCQRGPVSRRMMPGVIWDQDENGATFVTFDGGRYQLMDARALNPGTVARAAWRPLVDAYFTPGNAGTLAEEAGDEDAAKVTHHLGELAGHYDHCATPVWDQAAEAHRAAAKSIKDFDAREEARRASEAKAMAEIATTCGAKKQAYVDSWAAYLDQRAAARMAIFDEAAARLAGK